MFSARPVWLFTSGPLGTDLVGEDGNDIVERARSEEFDELSLPVNPIDERVFFRAHDPDAKPIGMGERLVRVVPAARDSLPAGELRSWDAIDVRADEVARELAHA